MNCGTVALGWSCELKSKRGKKQKGEFTHGSNFNGNNFLRLVFTLVTQTRRWNPKMAKYIFTERNRYPRNRLAANCKVC